MERFIGTDTASVELFFNTFTSEIETFAVWWDQLSYPVSYNAESNGRPPHLFIPSKIAPLVPEFEVKDLYI